MPRERTTGQREHRWARPAFVELTGRSSLRAGDYLRGEYLACACPPWPPFVRGAKALALAGADRGASTSSDHSPWPPFVRGAKAYALAGALGASTSLLTPPWPPFDGLRAGPFVWGARLALAGADVGASTSVSAPTPRGPPSTGSGQAPSYGGRRLALADLTMGEVDDPVNRNPGGA